MGIGIITAAKISKALGGFGITVKQYIDAQGIERVIISSLWNDPKKYYAVVNGLNIKKIIHIELQTLQLSSWVF